MESSCVIQVEVCCKQNSKRLEQLQEELEDLIRKFLIIRRPDFNSIIEIENDNELLYNDVESLLVDCGCIGLQRRNNHFRILKPEVHKLESAVLHFYRLHRRDVECEMLEDDAGGDTESIPSSNHWLMPSLAFDNLWENLIFDDDLKEKLLGYALTALAFSQHKVNPNIITCNRLMLFHGPPGTGKTSLCKALAQKLAIRIHTTYKFTHLIEINSHSLFSKWFSESGKLVMKLFAKIREIVTQPKSFVCVLIDEVESLAYARDCMSGEEPKDAMRVVNALLTQLDSIREYPNVLILATSNIATTIDGAFLDRADIRQYIGLPSGPAIRQIYNSIIMELMRVGIVKKMDLEIFDSKMFSLMSRSIGLNGRTLRKLPYLALASCAGREGCKQIDVHSFFEAMYDAIKKHQNDKESLKKRSEETNGNCSKTPTFLVDA